MAGTTLRTLALFGVIIAVFVVAGGILGDYLTGSFLGGLLIALVLSLVLNVVTYFFCDRIVLWTNHAKIVTAADVPRLAAIVDELAPLFGLEKPRLALIPTQTPNAFATGRNAKHAVVAATEGILRALNDRELRGVLAHELAHIKDRDILVMTFAATLAGAISYAAQMVFFSALFGGGGNSRGGVSPITAMIAAITAPIAAILIQLAISRSRESAADEVGARTIHDPNSLADALEKLESANLRQPMTSGSPASSSLYIVNPFRGGFGKYFSTHPPTAERVRKLRAMASDFAYRPSIRAPSIGARPVRS
jgi:heat shock protein HtpX